MIRFFFFSIILLVMIPACQENHSPAIDAHPDTAVAINHLIDSLAQYGSAGEDSIITPGDIKTFNRHALQDTIVTDLNGDNQPEKAYFQWTGVQRHLFIVDGKTNKSIQIGSDTSFTDMGNDFAWVDTWGLTKDTTTFEVLVADGELTGSRTITLQYPSIVVRKEESGGGVITCKENRYQWVHQSD